MEKWDFSVTSDRITWDLAQTYYQSWYKGLYPQEPGYTTIFWQRFDNWLQKNYKVINKPSHTSVYAFANQEDYVEFILKWL
jgi:hypothetical protein